MAEREERIILIRVDASAAVEGSRAATSALERMERGQAAAGTSLDRLEKSLGRVGLYLKAQLAFMVADVGSRLVQMGKDAFNAAAGLDELAEQLGVSARNLQALQFAAVQSGVKLEQLETGVSKFSQKIGDAAGGNKEMLESLNALGVKILDTNGKLRPTEAIMQNVAAAILAIDDPAKRAAAAVDFFGKAGTRMLPLLPEIARGFAEMGASAERAGAIISSEAIAKLDKLSDTGEKTKLVLRALFAETAAGPLAQALDLINGKIANLIGLLKSASTDLTALLALAANPIAFAGRAFGSTPGESAAKATATARSSVEAMENNLGLARTDRDRARINKALGLAREEFAKAERAQGVIDVGGKSGPTYSDPDNMGVYVPPRSAAGGASNPPPKTTGGNAEADRIAKLERDTARELEAAGKLAEASTKGARAVEQLEIHYKALKSAQDAYGNTADKNTGQVAALTAKIEAQMTAAEKLKAIKEFNLGTEELEKQNELLAAENKLINETVEVRSREIALIKLKHETQRSGLDASNQAEREAIERREAAITQNERMKAQAEELKRANELWTAPLKSALESIQRTAADAFEQMLESGKFNFESLGQALKKTVTRMIAEFMALSTIRPVMNVLVNAVGGQSMASAMGMGGGASTGSLMGGGSSGSMMSGIGDLIGAGMNYFGGGSGGGGLGGMFGQGAFGTTIGAAGAGGVTAVGAPIGGYTATLGANGLGTTTSMFSGSASGASMSGGFSGAMGGAGSFAGMAGGALGLGMGAYSLASGGTKTTKGTIAGVGQMVGGALMMIPTGYTQIAGAIIMALSSIIPSLMGDPNKIDYDREYGELGYGKGGFFTTGGAWGADANAKNLEGPLGKAGQTMDTVFKAFGGIKEAGKVWGVALQSYKETYSAGGSFKSATSFLVGPNGERRQWGTGSADTPGDVGMEAAAVAATLNSLLGGAVGDLTKNMRKALEGVNVSGKDTFETLGKVVAEVMAYDETLKNLGKTTTDAEQALKAVDDGFKAMFETADKYGLDKTELNQAKDKARSAVGKEFIDSIARQLMSAGEAAMLDIGEERKVAYENNAIFLKEKVPGYVDQALNIEKIYQEKRLAIMEEGTRASLAAQQAAADAAKAKIQSLQDLIDRLTYGDLANASPTTAFSGTRATYMATLAQARAGNADAMDRLGGTAEAYANAGRSYFASSSEYAGLVEQIRRDLQERQGAIAAGASTNPQTTEQINALMRTISQQAQMFADAQNENRQLREEVAALVAQLQRRA